MKNHFFIPYAGNKRNECEKLYIKFKQIKKKIKYIIEPFCGTSAFSYYISIKEPKKYTYILNDNNKYLIELYNIAKDKVKLNELITKLNNLTNNLDKIKYKELCSLDNLDSWIIKNKIYNIRSGLWPLDYKPNNNYFTEFENRPIVNFLRTEKIIFSCKNAIDILNENNNSNSFLFLDPPYLTECNDFYYNKDINIYEHLYKNNINNFNCYISLIVSENWIINLLFGSDIKEKYNKKYEVSKKNINHLLIANY